LSSVHPIDECPVLFFTRNPRLAAHNVGRDYSISQQILRYDAGRMKVKCRSCKALIWIDERSNKAFSNPIFHICCGKGKYVLHPFPKLHLYFRVYLKEILLSVKNLDRI
jgi:hypothetical protein